jgi:endonuclease V-like protein UPF0215 family
MKPETRVLGIDDSPFDKFIDKTALVIGCFYRSNKLLEGVLSIRVDVDGNDATIKIINMINSSKFKPQIQIIFLDGIAVAGLNIVDIKEVYTKTKIPVIIVIRREPRIKSIISVLEKLNMNNKINYVKNAGRVYKYKNIYFQKSGINEELAKDFLKISIKSSEIPEAVRIAHIIGAGIIKGESKGRA